jgi:hypothetical protein
MLSQFLGPYWEGLLTGVMLTLTPSLLGFFVLLLASSQDEGGAERPESDVRHCADERGLHRADIFTKKR